MPLRSGAELPFKGTFTSAANATFSPPVTLVVDGTATGTATHLGRFTATYTHYVDTTSKTATGTIRLTAANGDVLVADLAGGEEAFVPPNTSHTRLAATVVSGTGRFAGATGTFTIREEGVIDFAAATSTGSASLEGSITLTK